MNEQRLFENAMLYATIYHAGQVDKAGEPYLLHVVTIALAPGLNLMQRTCALLHDILEDTDVGIERLRQAFPSAYIDVVIALTHLKTETNDEYYARVLKNPDARLIKVVDVEHNYYRLYQIKDDETRLRLEKKYTHALAVLAGGNYFYSAS